MIKKTMFLGMIIILSLVSGTASVLAHPSDNYVAKQLPACYDREGYTFPGAEHSYNDLTFVDQYPSPALMSNSERYMLLGTIDGPPEYCDPGNGLLAWHILVNQVVRKYYKRFGKIPELLTPEVYAAANGIHSSEVDPFMKELIRNPITDEYANLTSQEFSPGDMYIEALDPDEMAYFSGLNDHYYQVWYNSRVKRNDGTWREIEFCPPVLYVRMYGRTDTIKNSLHFGFNMIIDD